MSNPEAMKARDGSGQGKALIVAPDGLVTGQGCFGVDGGGVCWMWSRMMLLALMETKNRGFGWWEKVVDHGYDYSWWLLLWNGKKAKFFVQEFLMITPSWDPGPFLDSQMKFCYICGLAADAMETFPPNEDKGFNPFLPAN